MIQYKIFHGVVQQPALFKSGANKILEEVSDAHDQARAWISANTAIEVISVSNGHVPDGGDFGVVFVSVWYRAIA